MNSVMNFTLINIDFAFAEVVIILNALRHFHLNQGYFQGTGEQQMKGAHSVGVVI